MVVVESTFVMWNSVDGAHLVVVMLMRIKMEEIKTNSNSLQLASILHETCPHSHIIGVCFPKDLVHFYLRLCSCTSMTLA